jgi:hypothetical protein
LFRPLSVGWRGPYKHLPPAHTRRFNRVEPDGYEIVRLVYDGNLVSVPPGFIAQAPAPLVNWNGGAHFIAGIRTI